MNRQYNNLILNLKSIESKGLFNDIEIRLNSRKLLNPEIDGFDKNRIEILHDRGRLKIFRNKVSDIRYLSVKPFKVEFKFNRTSKIEIESKR